MIFTVACSSGNETSEPSPVVDTAAAEQAAADAEAEAAALAEAAAKAEADKVAAEAEAEAAKAEADKAKAEKEAAEKALTEATEANKAEAEKLLAEKVEAEKVAIAAAAKAEADKVALAKAAADKVAADKVAADKAAAVKAAADKAAADKAAADKAVVNLKGTINIDGSSTVYPISEAVSEEFGKTYKDVRVPVGVSGTGGGFKRFCAGETDISNASRPIKSTEAAACKEKGIEYTELSVTFDGLTVVIHKDNTWAKTMTTGQLKALFKSGSTVKTWKDLNPAWPDDTIKIYSPGADSGTFDYFTEIINGKAKDSRNDSQISFSEDDNVLVQGVSGDKNSIGYFGFSYYEENASKLNAVLVDAGNGGVGPSFKSISNGSYAPLSRPLYIYMNNKAYNERPEVKVYVKFFLDNVKKVAGQVGFIPLTDAMYETQKAKLK